MTTLVRKWEWQVRVIIASNCHCHYTIDDPIATVRRCCNGDERGSYKEGHQNRDLTYPNMSLCHRYTILTRSHTMSSHSMFTSRSLRHDHAIGLTKLELLKFCWTFHDCQNFRRWTRTERYSKAASLSLFSHLTACWRHFRALPVYAT